MAGYDVLIEIPKGSRNKYEIDHVTGRVYLDRVLFTSMVYPVDYGFFDNTLGLDGEPVDALVLLDTAIYPGTAVKVRPVGVLRMTDEAGSDDKVLAVPYKDPRWQRVQDLDDVSKWTRDEFEHFFARYKDLEPNKFVTIEGWGGAAEAEQIVQEGFTRLQESGQQHQ